MKRRKLLSLFSVLAFVLSVQFSVLGASGPGAEDAPADMSGAALNAQEREAFHRDVADDEAFIHLVTTAAEHKGRDVSLEGVHPDKCLKLYGLKRSEQSLIESLCGVYGETGKIESLFSDDYGVLVLYVNENDEYVDSFVFTRKENLPGAQDKNGWVPLGSGSLTTDENFLAQYSKDGDLSKYITGLGLKNTSRLILTTAIPYLPTCIYFVQENEEFLLPLEDGRAGIQGLQVYRVKMCIRDRFYPALTMLFLYRNTLLGLGNGVTPMLAGVCELLSRMIGAPVLGHFFGFTGLCWINPIAWVTASGLLFLSYRKTMRNIRSVSYTHLDVYKRQGINRGMLCYLVINRKRI